MGNSVYEYGAQAFNILPDGRLIFSNKGNTVGILNPQTGDVKVLPQDPIMRYASFFAVPASSWVLAIEEDHTDNKPTGVRNYIVAINTDTEEIKRVITGADFYFNPAVSPDGKKISWLEWMHPQMMFESAQVHIADWSADGSVSNTRCISGKHDESVAEPRWGPDGSFFFAQEVDGYRQLFRIAPGKTEPVQIKTKGLEDSDLGHIGLGEGMYVPYLANIPRMNILMLTGSVPRTPPFPTATSSQRRSVKANRLLSASTSKPASGRMQARD